MASGSLFTKIHKGFQEFQRYGLIEETPVRMIGAQAEGCSPITTAWRNETTQHPSRQAEDDRQVARNRQSGRRLLRAQDDEAH